MRQIGEVREFQGSVKLLKSMEREEKKLKTVRKIKEKIREEVATRNQKSVYITETALKTFQKR
jgi:hypothetical protein